MKRPVWLIGERGYAPAWMVVLLAAFLVWEVPAVLTYGIFGKTWLVPWAVAQAQTVKNPCWAWVHVITRDSVYAELQAPRGLKVCKNVELQGIP